MGKADYYKHRDWNAICDVCGFKYKASEIKLRWDGVRACKEDWEVRHPQELIRNKHDDQSVEWTRPMPPPDEIYDDQIIQFGSTSSAVLFQSALTSAAAITDAGGTIIGSGNTYDATQGMKLTIGVAGGCEFVDFTGYQLLTNQGQISIDMEATFLGLTDTTLSGSEGVARDGTTNWALSWNANNGSPFGYFRMSGENFTMRMHNSDSGSNIRINTQGKSQFVTLTLSWYYSDVKLFIGGIPVDYAIPTIRTNQFTDMMKRISVGNLARSPSSVENQTYFRNLIVSSNPVVDPFVSQVGNLGFFGHSFVTLYGISDNNTNVGDSGLVSIVQRELQNYGAKESSIIIGGVGGGYVENGRGANLSEQITDFMVNNPDYVFYIGGTNDAGNPGGINEANFTADIKSQLSAILSLTSVKHCIVCTIPTVKYGASKDTAPHVAGVAALNAIINTLPAWWAATKTGGDGDLSVVDMFALTGGESPTANTFRGQFESPPNSDLHLGAKGMDLSGTGMASALIDLL